MTTNRRGGQARPATIIVVQQRSYGPDRVPPDPRGAVSYQEALLGNLCRHSFGHVPTGPLDIHAPLCCGRPACDGWCEEHQPHMTDQPARVQFDRRIM